MDEQGEERQWIERELNELDEEIDRLRQAIASHAPDSPLGRVIAQRFEQTCRRRQELNGSAAPPEWQQGGSLTRFKRELENIWEELKYAATHRPPHP